MDDVNGRLRFRDDVSTEDPDVERQQWLAWGVWREDPHCDGDGGEG